MYIITLLDDVLITSEVNFHEVLNTCTGYQFKAFIVKPLSLYCWCDNSESSFLNVVW